MFWKRPVNLNFVVMLATIMLVCVFAILCGRAAGQIESESARISEEAGRDTLGDTSVSGYAALFEYTGAAAVWFASALLELVMVVLLFFSFIALLFLDIARCVYKNEGKRLLAYRILMGIVSALMIFQSAIIVFFLQSPVTLAIALIILAVTVWSMVNTYSRRIRK